MVPLAAQAASTHTFSEHNLRQSLSAIAQRSYATGEAIEQALEEGFKQGVDHAMSDGIIRKHLDIREIPALLEGVLLEGVLREGVLGEGASQDGDEPLSYIGCSEKHAVAVVDECLQDSWDSREMGDRTKYVREGTLVELWIKTDDESVVEKVQEIIRKYERVRRYDDVLTYGRKRRNAVTND